MHAKVGTGPVLVLSTIGKAGIVPWLMWVRVPPKKEEEEKKRGGGEFFGVFDVVI